MKRMILSIMILALICTALSACADPELRSGTISGNNAKDTGGESVITVDTHAETEKSLPASETESSKESLNETDSGETVKSSLVGSWVSYSSNVSYGRWTFTEDGKMTVEEYLEGKYTVSGDLVTVSFYDELELTYPYRTEFSMDDDVMYYEDGDIEKTLKKSDGTDGVVGTWTGENTLGENDGSKTEYRFADDGKCCRIGTVAFSYEDLGDGRIDMNGDGEINMTYTIEGDVLTLNQADGIKLFECTREK